MVPDGHRVKVVTFQDPALTRSTWNKLISVLSGTRRIKCRLGKNNAEEGRRIKLENQLQAERQKEEDERQKGRQERNAERQNWETPRAKPKAVETQLPSRQWLHRF